MRIPPGPEEWKRFDGEWSFQRSSTTGTFSLTQGLGYCVLTRNGYRQVWVIELLEVFDGNLVDFGLYPLGEEDDVTVWTGNVRDNGDVGVFRALFSVSPLPDAPFLLRRRE